MATPRPAAKRVAAKPTDKVEEAVEELVEAIEETVIEEIAEEIVEQSVSEEPVLIHCIRDGATAFGNVWYMGQEVEVDRSSEAYRSTVGRDGTSWIDRLFSEPGYRNHSWKLGPATMPNELINYPRNFDPRGMTYHKGEWLDLVMLRQRAERETARGRKIPASQY